MKVRWNFPLRGGAGLKGVGNEKICGGKPIGPRFVGIVWRGFVGQAEGCNRIFTYSCEAEHFRETISVRARKNHMQHKERTRNQILYHSKGNQG